MDIRRITLGTEYELTLTFNQIVSIEKALYKAIKQEPDPDGYTTQFSLRDFLDKERKVIKEVNAAKEQIKAESKLNLRRSI
jgi:hypothetical protein